MFIHPATVSFMPTLIIDTFVEKTGGDWPRLRFASGSFLRVDIHRTMRGLGSIERSPQLCVLSVRSQAAFGPSSLSSNTVPYSNGSHDDRCDALIYSRAAPGDHERTARVSSARLSVSYRTLWTPGWAAPDGLVPVPRVMTCNHCPGEFCPCDWSWRLA
jgi:hypothetical protein